MFSVVLKVRARSADGGAMTYLYAIGAVGEESHGAYLSDNKVAE